MSALDIYTPPKPNVTQNGIFGLDDEEPISKVPSFAAVQRLERADRAAQQALAIQRQAAEQSAAQEKRQQAEYDRAEEVRRNPPPIPANLKPSGYSIGPDGKRTQQFSEPTQVTTGMVTEKDVVEAGLDPNSIPRNSWSTEVAKVKRGEKTVESQNKNVGQQEVDKKYAADFLEWTQGGEVDATKGRAQLMEAQKQLDSGKNLTGPIIGMLPDSVLRFTNPEAVQTRETIEEVVQRNLKAVLGGAFTKGEGDRLIARAYNPGLSEEQNSVRLKRLLKQIELATDTKAAAAAHYRTYGTIRGWEGRMPRLSDFDPETDATPGTGTTPAQPPAQPPIRMRTPGGQIIIVPAANVPAAQARGATPL